MRFATAVAIAAFATSALGLSGLAQGQTPAAFVGTWKVTWAGENRTRQARLALTEAGGTWQTYEPDLSKTKKDRCKGLEVPVSIESAAPDRVLLKLNYATSLAGCHDSKVMLTRVDEKTITGKRRDVDMSLSRE